MEREWRCGVAGGGGLKVKVQGEESEGLFCNFLKRERRLDGGTDLEIYGSGGNCINNNY